jgi:hypothetical protein
MKPSVAATATDKTLPRTYSGSRQKVVAHDIGSAPDGARIAALTHAARRLELRIAAPLAVVARVNMGDAHDVRGGSNGAQREPLTKSEPAADATDQQALLPRPGTGRSMVEYLVGRGVHYFTIIWPQPAARARPLGHG